MGGPVRHLYSEEELSGTLSMLWAVVNAKMLKGPPSE
jgi:hypothetical protein